MRYDVAVAGVGAMGSAVLAHCARRGASAIGLEQFGRGHELGSSSGKSRLIRQAYFEDPAYVPLLRRAYELWAALEEESGAKIFHCTGLLTVGEAASDIIAGTRRAATEHQLPIESLSQREVAQRYPTLKLLPEDEIIFETEGGVLVPETANAAHLRVAEASGAEIRFGVAMTGWSARNGGFEVQLADGETITAKTLVLSLGPWFRETLESLGVSIRIQRNVQTWFASGTEAYRSPGFPAFLVNRRGFPAALYGCPDFGEGVKFAFHGLGDFTEADRVEREVDFARDVAPLVRAANDFMPGAAETLRDAKVCMYTLTRDEHFVIDRHPEHPNLILCGGFSGHGFKFAPVIGEVAADLALESGSRHAIDFLSLERFRA